MDSGGEQEDNVPGRRRVSIERGGDGGGDGEDDGDEGLDDVVDSELDDEHDGDDGERDESDDERDDDERGRQPPKRRPDATTCISGTCTRRVGHTSASSARRVFREARTARAIASTSVAACSF